jgi:hypothetical protein
MQLSEYGLINLGAERECHPTPDCEGLSLAIGQSFQRAAITSFPGIIQNLTQQDIFKGVLQDEAAVRANTERCSPQRDG